MGSTEDKMQRKADGTYTVTMTGLSLDEALAVLNGRRSTAQATSVDYTANSEVHHR